MKFFYVAGAALYAAGVMAAPAVSSDLSVESFMELAKRTGGKSKCDKAKEDYYYCKVNQHARQTQYDTKNGSERRRQGVQRSSAMQKMYGVQPCHDCRLLTDILTDEENEKWTWEKCKEGYKHYEDAWKQCKKKEDMEKHE